MTNANTLSKAKEPIRTLRKIRRLEPLANAIIAGGYHRDLYNEKEYNDVDIYLAGTFDGHYDCAFWKSFFNLQISDYRSMDSIEQLSETDEEYDIENNAQIVDVFGMVMNEIKYNLIVTACDPIDYVHRRFDFGICKVYCDGTKITFTKEFMSDVENKTFTFSDQQFSKANFNHAMHIHLTKLKAKYPEHKLVVPEVHQKRYQEYKKFLT